jgi:hypothetical protein
VLVNVCILPSIDLNTFFKLEIIYHHVPGFMLGDMLEVFTDNFGFISGLLACNIALYYLCGFYTDQ